MRKSDKEHENLQKFLQLDPNYPQLIMLKKVAKALDEMAKNEELMEGILAAAVGMDGEEDEAMDGGRVGGGEIEQPGQEDLRDDLDEDEGDQRLGTIGEDRDEDRHIYDTNMAAGKQSKKGESSTAGLRAEKSGEGEEDYEF